MQLGSYFLLSRKSSINEIINVYRVNESQENIEPRLLKLFYLDVSLSAHN